MYLLRNLPFVTESPPLLPIPSLFPTPLRSRLPSLLPGARRKRTKHNSGLLLFSLFCSRDDSSVLVAGSRRGTRMW